MNTNTETTQACGIAGRYNIKIEPTEIFTMTSTPDPGYVALVIEGTPYFIHRDARRHPHLSPVGGGVTNVDGTMIWMMKRAVEVIDGDKIAFDHKGDVWTLRAPAGGCNPYMEAC